VDHGLDICFVSNSEISDLTPLSIVPQAKLNN